MSNEQKKSPLSADEQDSPQQERPVPETEVQRTEGQADKPSQAEGDRETVEQDLRRQNG